MSPAPAAALQLLQSLAALQQPESAMQATLRALDGWLAPTLAPLCAGPLRCSGLAASHPLAAAAQAINDWGPAQQPVWQGQRDDLAHSQALAGMLEHSAVLLVFGKFNAGKSSLCNFLAEHFAALGEAVEHFTLVDGALAALPQGRFAEGSTETTATLQGVRLGRRLVLLDTPGLHSATPENAALTQRFADSADGVLWLTSSSSPGQVQELGELARELRRSKPLLPLLTRSDWLEEDEAAGEIVKQLRNKTAAHRALQEDDVARRGREQLALLGADPALLCPPVSLSVHAARSQGLTAAALEDAGFERLWAALAQLLAPALAYRQRKPAEVVLHHLEENVLHDLEHGLAPRLAALQQAIATECKAIAQTPPTLVGKVWRSVLPELPELLESHAETGDVAVVLRQLDSLLAPALAQAVQQVLPGYKSAPSATMERPAPLLLGAEVGYERVDGSPTGYERLHAALEQALHALLSAWAAQQVQHCLRSLQQLQTELQALQSHLQERHLALAAIKNALRAAR